MSGLSGAANFFSAGGDSLSAMQAIARLRAAGIPADVTRLYEAPTLAEFIQLAAGPTELITFILAFVSRSSAGAGPQGRDRVP
jgi:aryl carrier-like protein